MNAYDLFHSACAYLKSQTDYPQRECEALVAGLLEWHWGLKRVDVLVKKEVQANAGKTEEWQKFVERLAQYEPLQHLIKEVIFAGYSFEVSPDVLIPRPETEEWVLDLATRCAKMDFSPTFVLDVCTGSGCIASTLSLAFGQASVEAWDISAEALDVAKRNAARLGAQVSFVQVDALQQASLDSKIACLPKNGLLVSNPPYIPEQERALMQRNVLDFEPALALFVPDESPLIFYERLAYLAEKWQPSLFVVEIHENFGVHVSELFEKAGYKTDIFIDFHGKARAVWGFLPTQSLVA